MTDLQYTSFLATHGEQAKQAVQDLIAQQEEERTPIAIQKIIKLLKSYATKLDTAAQMIDQLQELVPDDAWPKPNFDHRHNDGLEPINPLEPHAREEPDEWDI